MAIWKKVITAADDSNYKNSNVTVSDLGGGSGSTFLKKDGTWATPTDTNTQLSTEQVQDIIGGMVDGGTETRCTVTYDDTNGKLNFVIDDMNDTVTAGISDGNYLQANDDVSDNDFLKVSGTQIQGRTAGEVRSDIGAAALAGSTSQNFSTNDLAVTGNLTVTGTIDTVSSTNSTLVDKTITLSSGSSTEAASDGSGIVVNTGQTLEPKLYFYDDTTSTNTDGRIGTGWMMGSLTETQSSANDYHVMGFKTGNGAPGTGIKANGEGAFYWDNNADELYVCTSAYTNTGGG